MVAVSIVASATSARPLQELHDLLIRLSSKGMTMKLTEKTKALVEHYASAFVVAIVVEYAHSGTHNIADIAKAAGIATFAPVIKAGYDKLKQKAQG